MGGSLANWLLLSIWWKNVWRINRSANRLLIVSTNLDGFSLVKYGWFTKLSSRQTFLLYGTVERPNLVGTSIETPKLNSPVTFTQNYTPSSFLTSSSPSSSCACLSSVPYKHFKYTCNNQLYYCSVLTYCNWQSISLSQFSHQIVFISSLHSSNSISIVVVY